MYPFCNSNVTFLIYLDSLPCNRICGQNHVVVVCMVRDSFSQVLKPELAIYLSHFIMTEKRRRGENNVSSRTNLPFLWLDGKIRLIIFILL